MRAKNLILAASVALGATVFAAVQAQTNEGYWTSNTAGAIWKNSSGSCFRAGYWTPAIANSECDPDLVPKAAPPVAPARAPAPAAPSKAAAQPAPSPKPVVINLAAAELFEFNKATLTQGAKAKLDSEVLGKLKEIRDIRFINVSGHTDRLGSAQYNQKLSERRAEAVKAYLVSRGADASKIETYGFGKTMPVKACPDQKNRKVLIECLAPNRRVVVEIQGGPR